METVGFFGLGNNPAQIAHLLMANYLRRSGLFTTLIACPYGYSSEKPLSIARKHKIELARLAFPLEWREPTDGCARFLVDYTTASDVDIPTANRFRLLRTWFPTGSRVIFITGSDRLDNISSWDMFHEQLQHEEMMIIPREGFFHPGNFELKKLLPKAEWLVPEIPLPAISSTLIRQLIKDNDPSWESLVNENVRDYIKLHNLYKDD